MNLNIFIILLLLNLYFGKCNSSWIISTDSSCWHQSGDLEPKVLDARWTGNSSIVLTLQAPKNDPKRFGNKIVAPAALGHFTLNYNNGNQFRFSKNANFINGYNETNTGESYVGANPVNVVSEYSDNYNIPRGATVTVAVSIYYGCQSGFDGGNRKTEYRLRMMLAQNRVIFPHSPPRYGFEITSNAIELLSRSFCKLFDGVFASNVKVSEETSKVVKLDE
ncbi:35503_t:CDS:2, partial [Racocetra persica]